MEGFINRFNSGNGSGGNPWITNIPEMHRNIFRGKSLGSAVTNEQLTMINNGTFDDLYVGDYWTIPITIDNEVKEINWRIADIDRYLNRGDNNNKLTKHHLVIVSDSSLYSVSGFSNANGGQRGKYSVGSLRTQGLVKAKTAINEVFSDKVITYRNLFEPADTNASSIDTWRDATIEIMSQVMVFGGFNAQLYTGTPYPHRLDLTQLALFALAPQYIVASEPYCLRDQDQRSATYLLEVQETGTMSDDDTVVASNIFGIRPYFLIGVNSAA